MTDDCSYPVPAVCSHLLGGLLLPPSCRCLPFTCTVPVLPGSTATQLRFSGGRRICHFSFLSFQRGSWSNNCEMTLRRERSFGQKQGEDRLLPVTDSNVVLLAQMSPGFVAVQRDPQMDKRNSPTSDYWQLYSPALQTGTPK